MPMSPLLEAWQPHCFQLSKNRVRSGWVPAVASARAPKKSRSLKSRRLWPALHSRADLIRISQGDYLSYREVNAFMARALMRFRKPESAFWIQDYHFLALGAELRDLGVNEPIGFFLHTPWPTRAVMSGVPHHRQLIEAMLAYDLIGFQTEEDC